MGRSASINLRVRSYGTVSNYDNHLNKYHIPDNSGQSTGYITKVEYEIPVDDVNAEGRMQGLAYPSGIR